MTSERYSLLIGRSSRARHGFAKAPGPRETALAFLLSRAAR